MSPYGHRLSLLLALPIELTHARALFVVEQCEEGGQLPNRNSGAVFYRSGFRQENVSARIRFAISLCNGKAKDFAAMGSHAMCRFQASSRSDIVQGFATVLPRDPADFLLAVNRYYLGFHPSGADGLVALVPAGS